MMFNNYDIDNLFIANMRRSERKNKQVIANNIGICLIVKKINEIEDIWEEQFQEIFTNTNYRIFSEYNVNGEIVVSDIIPITPICNEKELLKGKITKKRLVEIYSNLNQEMLEEELQKYSEFQEKNKIKELMKKYDN